MFSCILSLSRRRLSLSNKYAVYFCRTQKFIRGWQNANSSENNSLHIRPTSVDEKWKKVVQVTRPNVYNLLLGSESEAIVWNPSFRNNPPRVPFETLISSFLLHFWPFLLLLTVPPPPPPLPVGQWHQGRLMLCPGVYIKLPRSWVIHKHVACCVKPR